MLASLAAAVALVESNQRLDALRFEPGLFVRMVAANMNQVQLACVKQIQKSNECTFDTARVIFSSSYGYYQILGETLYSTLGYKGTLLSFWNSPDAQYLNFELLTRKLDIAFTIYQIVADEAKRREFATKYNGPGNVDEYANRLLVAAQSGALVG